MTKFNLDKKLTDQELQDLQSFLKGTNVGISKWDREHYSQFISHSIVRHTDTLDNVFYDVYARDNDVDNEKDTEGKAKKANVLGTGSFGKVKPIISRLFMQDGRLVQVLNPGLVVKVMQRTKINSNEAAVVGETYRSVSKGLKRKGKQQEIVEYVMPHMPGSNLNSLRYDLKKIASSSSTAFVDRLNAVIAILEAVKAFHQSTGCIHGDLKLDNICYDKETKTAFLIDLSGGKRTIGKKRTGYFPNTPGYSAPEVDKQCKNPRQEMLISEKMDVYSLGVTIDLLLNGEQTFGEYNEQAEEFDMLPGHDVGEKIKTGKKLFGFLKKLVHDNSAKRPAINEAIEFFKDLRSEYSEEVNVTVTEEVGASYFNPDIYLKKLARLVSNIDDTIADMRTEQDRWVEKSNADNQKKNARLEIMIENLSTKKEVIQLRIKRFKEEAQKPEHQVFTAAANEKAKLCYQDIANFYKTTVTNTINLFSVHAAEHEDMKQHHNWLMKILRGIASIFSSTALLPKSGKALVKAEETLATAHPAAYSLRAG